MPSPSPVLKFRVTTSRRSVSSDVAAEFLAEREHGGRLEPVALAETDRLAGGEQLGATQEIGDRAGRLGRTGSAGVEDLGGQQVEHRTAACDGGFGAAHHQRQLAFLGLRRGAEGGRGDEIDASSRQFIRDLDGRHRVGGTEVDHDAAIGKALRQAFPAEADLAQFGGGGQHGDHGVAGLRHHFRRADGHAAIVIGEEAGGDVGDVVDFQGMVAGPQKAERDTRAEGADPDHAELQLRHSSAPKLGARAFR